MLLLLTPSSNDKLGTCYMATFSNIEQENKHNENAMLLAL